MRLEASDLRRFEWVSVVPEAGINVFTGDNGAGKTSVLEALHLMAYGRSFRGRVADGLIRTGAGAVEVFVEWQGRDGTHRAGLRHAGSAWSGRFDGANVDNLGDLCAALAVVTIEPGSHQLVMGGADLRRRFLDWGLFHVEQAFLPLWRRYNRALKQRNALLKLRVGGGQLDPWERELATSGELLTQARQRYLDELQPHLQSATDALLPVAGQSVFDFQPGWRREDLALSDALLLARDRDLTTGFTSVGPHRADWRIDHSGIPGRNALSRGQAKLTAFSVLLAQAEQHARLRDDWPVLALDDLASELDQDHQQRVVDWILASGAQVFLTGTAIPAALAARGAMIAMFHVEQGRIARI
jgi:DNA replication and repair protein RecF